jgi:hypothetical protein
LSQIISPPIPYGTKEHVGHYKWRQQCQEAAIRQKFP